jgi:hypothetical protein
MLVEVEERLSPGGAGWRRLREIVQRRNLQVHLVEALR